jgi:hypothetical protein
MHVQLPVPFVAAKVPIIYFGWRRTRSIFCCPHGYIQLEFGGASGSLCKQPTFNTHTTGSLAPIYAQAGWLLVVELAGTDADVDTGLGGCLSSTWLFPDPLTGLLST